MVFSSAIGDYSYTGINAVAKSVAIGKCCSISYNVSIGGRDQDYSRISTHPFSSEAKYGFVTENEGSSYFDEELTIGNDVWTASNATILRGLAVGAGAVIGGGTVVTKDVPAYAIVVGNPGRVLKYLFCEEVIE